MLCDAPKGKNTLLLIDIVVQTIIFKNIIVFIILSSLDSEMN